VLFRSEDPHPADGYGVARGLLFGTLFEACEKAGVEIVPNAPVDRKTRGPEGVFLGTARGERFGPFDFVLGADGSRSTLRGLLGEEPRARQYDFAALWAVGPCRAVANELYQVVRGTTILIGLLPMGGGRVSFFWGCRRSEVEALKARGFDAFRSEVSSLCPEAEEVFEEFRSFEQTALGTYFHMALRRWHDGDLLLLGDAAHAMSPHLGQGANLALLDAAAFARHLAETGDFASAASRLEAERRPQVRYYAQLSYLLTPFFQSGSRILGWGRDVALPLMTRIPR
jgi:2-polyprenyl-6-methoxyphenol hydroxylase-like FAD-dependent oxidoreductase